jgi:HEAT repeat protein
VADGASPQTFKVGAMNQRQRHAACLLARGLTQSEVGRLVDRSERTIRTWRDCIPGFRDEVERQRSNAGDTSAVGVLHELLHSQDESVRLRAAVALLRHPPEPNDESEAEPIIVYAPQRADA